MNVNIDIENTIILTERLVLRPWKLSDLDDFYEYAKVDGVGQMAGWKPHESKEESQSILEHFIEGKHTFALEFDGKVIGSLGFEKYNEEKYPEFADKKCCEIGFVLSKDYWGRGIMTEAVNAAVRYLFEETEVEMILCGHFLWNTRSARVQEKCGFSHYAKGTFTTRFGTVEDNQMNILTKEAWIERNKQ